MMTTSSTKTDLHMISAPIQFNFLVGLQFKKQLQHLEEE